MISCVPAKHVIIRYNSETADEEFYGIKRIITKEEFHTFKDVKVRDGAVKIVNPDLSETIIPLSRIKRIDISECVFDPVSYALEKINTGDIYRDFDGRFVVITDVEITKKQVYVQYRFVDADEDDPQAIKRMDITIFASKVNKYIYEDAIQKYLFMKWDPDNNCVIDWDEDTKDNKEE